MAGETEEKPTVKLNVILVGLDGKVTTTELDRPFKEVILSPAEGVEGVSRRFLHCGTAQMTQQLGIYQEVRVAEVGAGVAVEDVETQ